MALLVENLEREFRYHGMTLPDPNPRMSVDEVRQMHSAQYPELTNAKPMVDRKETPNGYREVISFTVPVGTKG